MPCLWPAVAAGHVGRGLATPHSRLQRPRPHGCPLPPPYREAPQLRVAEVAARDVRVDAQHVSFEQLLAHATALGVDEVLPAEDRNLAGAALGRGCANAACPAPRRPRRGWRSGGAAARDGWRAPPAAGAQHLPRIGRVRQPRQHLTRPQAPQLLLPGGRRRSAR
jgi:hypothetical protein